MSTHQLVSRHVEAALGDWETSSNAMLVVGLPLGLVDVQFLAFNSAATPIIDNK